MRERPKFVGMLLLRLILERVRVDRIEFQAELTCQAANISNFICCVPRYMQRDARRYARKIIHQSRCVELLLQRRGLLFCGKSSESCSTLAKTPRRDRHAETH